VGFARDQRGWSAFGQFGLRTPTRTAGGYGGGASKAGLRIQASALVALEKALLPLAYAGPA
jgi:hypothetical protein